MTGMLTRRDPAALALAYAREGLRVVIACRNAYTASLVLEQLESLATEAEWVEPENVRVRRAQGRWSVDLGTDASCPIRLRVAGEGMRGMDADVLLYDGTARVSRLRNLWPIVAGSPHGITECW
ncbi:hypothetical protein K8F61_18615 [Microbacterium resistens]|uniref:Uncharacterized protein n=1 Tax=Microbacterium resistens TaxID=156977 RepID=A0ABY3RUN7_9MICO|nr:hypothetical protein [Microbacterium resistens]UGS26599.1 hypothetical protein K8F61_18615 [Microbacterium resistens]